MRHVLLCKVLHGESSCEYGICATSHCRCRPAGSNRISRARRGTLVANRFAITVVELLVSMAIISILVAVLIPAVQKTRGAARRLQCQNNLRNIGLALYQATDVTGRFPACGNFGHDGPHHGWVIDALPWLDRNDVAVQWEKEQPIKSSGNLPLIDVHIPVLVCADDISVTGSGDLSYVVNGGVGFTVRYTDGTHDCPVDASWTRLDLNGNGVVCPGQPGSDGSPSDKDSFFKLGLFFNETWNWNITVRHHRFATVTDGLSQTAMLSENVRTGVNPARFTGNWATSNPYLTSFYIGNPCRSAACTLGNVDYGLANSQADSINSGLTQPEGTSPRPNSFHPGGVNMVFCDGRVQFLSQLISGHVYAALVSPQGTMLDGPLMQSAILE